MSNNLKPIIGIRVRAARKASGLTQARLAEAVNRTVEAISNIERGRSLPPLDLLDAIARVLGCSLPALVDHVEGTHNAERARLEAELAMLAKGLPVAQLRIAVRQIEALKA